VERDYKSKGVKFFYIYKALAHPETNGYITPFNLKERLMHVAEAKQTLGSRIPWICDNMNNDLKHALGNRPNSEFIIDPDGKIVVTRDWSSPGELRSDLNRLVGSVTKPTEISDLKMPTRKPPEKAPTGVVKRLAIPDQLSPRKTTVKESEVPHYAKLRAEMGNGKLYLGFFLDPLYKVHWNNKAPALTYTINTPSGVTVTPAEGKSATVQVDADADPREFLVSVDGRSSEPITVTVKYFACDDAETFCVPVTQEYLVSFDRDPDGGTRRRPGGRSAQNGPSSMGSKMAQMMQRVPVLNALDINSDGRLSAEEIESASTSLRKLDANGDDNLSGQEIRGPDRERPSPSKGGFPRERPRGFDPRQRPGLPPSDQGFRRPGNSR
tara:strand:- start:1285 stop:2430 length:1146 start_codon:yes stop_codon:yes gene_type:complete